MSIGYFPEMLSQRILVGIISVRRFDATTPFPAFWKLSASFEGSEGLQRCAPRTFQEHFIPTVRARNKQEMQRGSCDTAQEPKAGQKYKLRSCSMKGRGFHALRLLSSSPLPVSPACFELGRQSPTSPARDESYNVI